MDEYNIQYLIVPAILVLVFVVAVLVLSRGMPFAKKVVSSSWPVLIGLSLLCVLTILRAFFR